MSSASDLTKAQSIISPKLKLVSLSLVATSFVILLWSFLAKIPVNSNGKAYFVPAFKVKPFLTKSSGRVKLLQIKESNEIFNSIENLSSITGKKRSEFISTEKNISKIIDQYKFISIEDYKPINSINNGTLNLKKLKKNLDKLDNLVFKLDGFFSNNDSKNNNISNASFDSINQQKSFCYKKDYPIFFISNNDQKNNLLLEIQNSSDQLLNVSSRYNRLYNDELRELDSVKILKSKLSTAKDLLERKLITQTTYASLQQNYYSKVNNIAAISLERQGLVVGLNDSIAALQRASNIFLDNSLIVYDKNICILQQNIPDGSESLSGDQLGIGMPPAYLSSYKKKVLEKNNKTNKIGNSEKRVALQIPFFYLSDKDKGIKDGDKAVIYPNNVPKNKYGGIKAKVVSSKKILANEEDTQFITGFKNIRPFENEFNNGKLVFYGVIELDKDPNTLSGFKWTSGKGPNYPVLIGTEAKVLVTVGNEPPISKLLPSFR